MFQSSPMTMQNCTENFDRVNHGCLLTINMVRTYDQYFKGKNNSLKKGDNSKVVGLDLIKLILTPDLNVKVKSG